MQYFDIILFAVIAVFLALRLRSMLGGRDGFDGNSDDNNKSNWPNRDSDFGDGSAREDNDDNVIRLPESRADVTPAVDIDIPNPSEADAFDAGPLKDGINAVLAADPGFKVREFIDGSKMAFEMILSFYSEGNEKALKPLLSAEVFADFSHAIREREEKNQTLEETLVGISVAQLVEAYMEDRDAFITVKFESEQISALRDEDGTVIEGDPSRVEKATDFWTFSRNTRSRDPNWILVATGTLD
ncbi:MAG: Tim44/TimA family putative adaptor protein [Rhodospirillaceae bacterium]|nr:Tim44/TimA family putative adaptor protein [Rhodospirillaceae bacterium]